eukprot:TRINITY_DN8400_c0_g1_i1.p1 TRINITY_DN8400_c0_g1~~TRINITY_DN8400_c0_g1_i1.p1  ORF type:complete len:369 (+),score=43.37 TRINITY_DN8400_c0_g1_i1:119-1225(+)
MRTDSACGTPLKCWKMTLKPLRDDSLNQSATHKSPLRNASTYCTAGWACTPQGNIAFNCGWMSCLTFHVYSCCHSSAYSLLTLRMLQPLRNLSDAEKVAKLADHVQDALHNAAGGVTSRLRNAQEQGALDDAWQQYDATTARPTRPRKQAYHRGVTHDNAEDGPQQLHQTARRASIEAPPDSLNQGSRSDRKAASDDHRALSSKQMSQSARASNSLTSHSDDQRSRLSMSSAAFHRAIQSRHPDKKPDAMRSHKTKPFAMHHHQHRQNHDEHHHHWQYLVHRHTRRGDFKRKRPAEADDRKSSSQGRPVDDREPKAQGRSTDENVKARSPADSRSNGSREAFSPAELETVQTHSNHEPKDNSKIVTLV